MPPPTPIEPELEMIPEPEPKPAPFPADIVDKPPDIDIRLNVARFDPIAEFPRVWNERVPPPPIRKGMNPLNAPAYAMFVLPIPALTLALDIVPP